MRELGSERTVLSAQVLLVFSEDLQHGQTIAGVQIVNPFVGL